MLGRIVLKKKNVAELESLITSLKALPGDEIELSVDAGFFDRDNPVFAQEPVKRTKKVASPAAGLVKPTPASAQDELRKLVREKLKEKGLTQTEVCRRAGVSSSYLGVFLCGAGNMGPESAAKILPILDIVKAA
jgi:hypothetical protein